MAQARISVPQTAAKGAVIEIKTLIQHPMETGFRRDLEGNPIPVRIIHRFVCTYNGEQVFRADFHPAIAANPLAGSSSPGTTTMAASTPRAPRSR
jgi:sulfur-oxidizing protein SoxZ